MPGQGILITQDMILQHIAFAVSVKEDLSIEIDEDMPEGLREELTELGLL